MVTNETQAPPSGIQWSEEKPEFKLGGSLSPVSERYPEQIDDLYGESFDFNFVSGSPEDIASFHSGVVLFRVGGHIGGDTSERWAKGKVVTQYLARQHFPLHREAEIKGLFMTDDAPRVEELEVLAAGLMEVLALRPSIEELKGKV